MTPAPPLLAHNLIAACLHLRVTGENGVEISATIWPTQLTATYVSGIVEWQGTEVWSSLVSGHSDESSWGQRFLLVLAAAGQQSLAAVPLLGSTQWRLVHLTLPDIDGQPGDTVWVSLHRPEWTATLSSTRPLNLQVNLPIPVDLQQLDVGSIVTEMASRLLLQRPWLV